MLTMEASVRLTFLGGVNEVGGNTILLEDFTYKAKIFLDFGVNMERFMESYKSGEIPESINELVKVNILPDERLIPIENLYTRGFYNKKDWKKFNKVSNQKSIDQEFNSNLDAVLITHPHKDHYCGLSYLNRTIPVYAGSVTKKIIIAYSKSERFSLKNNFLGLNWKPFRTGTVLDINGVLVMPIHVDHSIPAAYGLILHTSAGCMVYTGDFRMHGPLLNMTQDFIDEITTNRRLLSYLEKENPNLREKIVNEVHVLICEGTKINRGLIESEMNVESDLHTLFELNPFDFMLVKYHRIDWDRFRTFCNITRQYGWNYIITEKDAYFYYLLNKGAIHPTMKNPNILEDDHILILKKGSADNIWQETIRQAIYKRHKQDRFIDYNDLKALSKNYVLYLTHLSPELERSIDFKKRGLFISSSIDPYAEEFFDNLKGIERKLRKYGVPSYRIHASGHAGPHDLINFINEVNPKILIPVHTDHQDFFKILFENSDINVVLGKKYESVEVKSKQDDII